MMEDLIGSADGGGVAMEAACAALVDELASYDAGAVDPQTPNAKLG